MTQEIIFTKKRNAKYLRIRMKGDGTCMVIVPFRVPMKWAEKFVEEKKEWIERARAKLPRIRPIRSYPSYLESKLTSLHFTTQRVAELNQHYGFSYGKISVRNQQTRWGSCSKRGNLNFNYRILFLPPHLADYLIVHELCHLKEFNHSPRFWALVAQGCLNYHACKKELRAWQ